MSLREIRLNSLVCRELNNLLHTFLRDRAMNISITEVMVSPDMHDAYVYFSVIGDEKKIADAKKFLTNHTGILRHKLFSKVKLKFSPRLNFRYDDSVTRGQRILQILDEL